MKRLYRSRSERMIAGVCGGIAQYLNIDPTLVRLAFVGFTLAGGAGVLLYALLAIIMPLEPAPEGEMASTAQQTLQHPVAEGETRREVQEASIPSATYYR